MCWRRSSVPLSIELVASWNIIRSTFASRTDLPLVFVDGLLLEQVLVNLLENAARYTPPADVHSAWPRRPMQVGCG